ncbi:Bbp16 family capsid cement protein [Pleomorphomonas sp. NRK KF1]|uniref:Bbp16 family capsid cement protein n=1 Tax=Pleomorphomonas sp. NRK KF1 TaxID=2943000 RepID=UPI0020435ECF|nr:hypothetical protein [Pleomorphomonas sp. NRK KF1]MCM5554101.1 hypothetical protein [Pleomorphomonas sp. NRK KF1]
MILDTQALFSDAQAVTATAASTNTIDFGPISPATRNLDVGKGDDVALLVQVVEDFNNLTSLQIDLELDSTTTFTPDRVIPLATVPLAKLKAGSQVACDGLPRGLTLQYGRLKYTVTGTAPTTGKITAGVVAGVQSNGVAI